MRATHSRAPARPAVADQVATADQRAAADQTVWELTPERGPDWLFVRLEAADSATRAPARLTESIWEMIREHHANRVVLELDGVERPDEALWESIAELGSRMRDSGGLIRVCGLAPADQQQRVADPDAVPCFASRTAAVGTRACPEGRCE